MSTTYSSRVTCHTFIIWDRGPRNRCEIDVQEIGSVQDEARWAIFVPGGGAWTREREGFLVGARRHFDDVMADGKKLCLWTLEEALVEAQLACAYREAEMAPMLERHDARVAAEAAANPAALFFILDSAIEEGTGLAYWRKPNGRLTVKLAEAGRFTAAQIPAPADETGWGIPSAIAEQYAKNGTVHESYTSSMIIGDDES